MRLRHIEVFHAVFTSGSISNAAKLLNVSQPSVSKVLRHAEDQLGYNLFDRVKGKLIPTNEGRTLFHEVARVYQEIDQLRKFSRNLGESHAGRVRIATTPALGLNLVPVAIAGFRAMHESVIFDVETLHYSEVVAALIEQRADIGLVFDPASRPGMTERLLGEGEFVCLARPEEKLPAKERIQISDLAGKEFVQLDNRGPLGRLLTTQLGAAEVELRTIATVETYHIAKQLVALGTGVTIVDEITARSQGLEDLAIRHLSPALKFQVKALTLESDPPPIIAGAFLDYLETVVTEFLSVEL